ncbi:hypothetical protein BX070DRAFT_251746 [Coemansia spiralis]|nr:hypothetical protein BX070DRAFT_251746 [Coemansia spiralis]
MTSYINYGKQASQLMWSLIEFIHRHAFSLCSDFVAQASMHWSPLQTITDVIGPVTLTYVVEAVFLYICSRIFISILGIFSSTLYRIFRLIVLILVIAVGVSFGLYIYFTATPRGQQQAMAPSGSFWLDQAMAFAGNIVPILDDTAQRGGKWHGKYAAHGQNQPPVNFQTQASGYRGYF